jgi:putative Holliday junction resolvase
MPNLANNHHFLALDIGEKRVGVAVASLKTLIANPLITLNNDSGLVANLKKLITDYQVETVIAGLPRTLSGEDSRQTLSTRQLIAELSKQLGIKILTQDEALSSVRAEEELHRRGKIHAKADIDKLAACLILEDYISQNTHE